MKTLLSALVLAAFAASPAVALDDELSGRSALGPKPPFLVRNAVSCDTSRGRDALCVQELIDQATGCHYLATLDTTPAVIGGGSMVYSSLIARRAADGSPMCDRAPGG